MKTPNEIGKKYGKLLVIQRLENDIRVYPSGRVKESSRWLCRCECGNEVPVLANNFRRGNSRSCGNCNPPELAATHALYLRYKSSAKSRGYGWNISEKEFKSITSKPCHYCGSVPSQISSGKSYRASYIYNGIDRVDNSKGYYIGNVVPCCKNCNSAKGTRTIDEFKSWIINLYHNL